MYRKMGSLIVVAVLALVFASSAAAASFEAHGSVEQVYATGLPADASTSLLDSSGTAIATRNANELGGVLFRNVQPGDGYKVRLNTTNEASGPRPPTTSGRRILPEPPFRT
jgi:opacity protein-like surface antigen